MGNVYHINKGVGRPIDFRGLKGQYIGCLAGGLVFLLLLFAGLYVLGVALYVLLPLLGLLGLGLFAAVNRLSARFGAQGLGKWLARRGVPRGIRFRSRRVFTGLKIGKGGRDGGF